MNRRNFLTVLCRVLPLAALLTLLAAGFAAPAQAQAPPAPTLTGTAGCGSAILSWTSSAGAAGYHVWRKLTPSGSYSLIATVSVTHYTNTGLTNGQTYYYVVTAFNSSGESARSNEVAVTPCCVPAAPTNLTATPGCGKVSLTWSLPSGTGNSYKVKRALTSGGPYTTLATVTGTSYTDGTVVNGTTYYYVVTALNGCGESPNSNQASATPSCL